MPENEYSHAEAQARYNRGAVEGIVRWAEMLLGQSVRQAPIEEGGLRGSADLEEPDPAELDMILAGEGGVLEWRIIYPLVYAAYQHRGMRYDGSHVIRNHPKGGKIHYLSDPLKANMATFERAIATGARKALA